METQEKSFIRDKNLKVNCECGGCYTKENKANHFKSIKHNQFFSEQQTINQDGNSIVLK